MRYMFSSEGWHARVGSGMFCGILRADVPGHNITPCTRKQHKRSSLLHVVYLAAFEVLMLVMSVGTLMGGLGKDRGSAGWRE